MYANLYSIISSIRSVSFIIELSGASAEEGNYGVRKMLYVGNCR